MKLREEWSLDWRDGGVGGDECCSLWEDSLHFFPPLTKSVNVEWNTMKYLEVMQERKTTWCTS